MASPLPSTASAADLPALFGDFSGTTGPSDFPRPSITGVCPWTSRCSLRPLVPQADVGPPGSRARCFRACPGSQTARGPLASRAGDALGVAFRLSPRRRHPGVVQSFRGSIPGPHVPLSTLHPRPYGRWRMTRSRCGSLRLHRTKLPFATPRRFCRRTEMRCKLLGEEHRDAAASLNFMGETLRQKGEFGEAEEYFRAALAMRRKHLGEDSDEVASTRTTLSELQQRRGGGSTPSRSCRRRWRFAGRFTAPPTRGPSRLRPC